MTTRTLTPVFDGAVDLPVRVGWYPCWPKMNGNQCSGLRRQFWDGTQFSAPAFVGESDRLASIAQRTKSIYNTDELYWCGLTAPY